MTTPLAWLDALQGSGIRPGLSRMRALLRALSRPERACPAVIVAGTNGKGSTSATLDSILRSAGYRTGFYTSPHLVDLRERWQVEGAPIDAGTLEHCIAELRGAAGISGITPTYFEALTLIAFIAFREAKCELAVLEVGMGGRLDATNVVRPIASLITAVGFDHTEYLGNTIRRIAREKAGVIHRGAVALTSNADPCVLEVLRQRCAGLAVSLHVVPAETRASEVDELEDGHGTGQRFTLRTPSHSYVLETPLLGEHQLQNVSLAVRAAEELQAVLPRITYEAIRSGVRETRWRGRLERVMCEGKAVWIDGAHNAHAVRLIAEFVEAHLPRPRLLLFGIMADKDVGEFARAIVPRFDRVIATEPYRPRCASAGELAAAAEDLGVPATPIAEPFEAMEAALCAPEAAVLICGSLYLAGAAVEFFDRRRE
jgi:dihydrofolate synthase/folylpolyglutamate synthase